MACTNCFNGCSEVTSDKCVKYTGPTIEALGISNGDTLMSVENNITTYLLTALDGTGIVPYIDPLSLCSLVSSYLPVSGTINLVDITDALIKSICNLQGQITTNTNAIATLNADYDVSCLSGVVNADDTHEVLQATIDALCVLTTTVSDLAIELSTNYVAIADINTYISTYLVSAGNNLVKSKMIPYVAVEYYGPLTYFDASGAGTGDWIDIYLCNGNNGTPDKRGRVGVGAITGMGGGALDSAVDPATSTNPNYALGTKTGANAVTLTPAQMPSHTHTATSTDSGHTHGVDFELGEHDASGTGLDLRVAPPIETTVTSGIGIANITTTIDATGGGQSHNNIQPVIAAYYIIYLP